ncbi:MAG: HEAT repeat domain-containing protein [Planctomycetes bacterium]|nr:HEAT repeat domain-containing protein [Planctomycetota bacterium]
MAKRSVEAQLEEIAALGREPAPADLPARLAEALASKSNLVASRAAALAARLNRTQAVPDLVAMFERFLPDAKAPDKGCIAKTAAAKALYELGDAAAAPVFVRGIRHVQREGSFGPPVDTATELRGLCGLGLVRIGHRDALRFLTDLLSDPEPQARSFAARGLAYSGRDEGALLLRLKLQLGEPDIDALSECMAALARLEPAESLPLLVRFLDDDDPDVRASSALALGETRQVAALDALRAHLIRERSPESRSALLVAAAGMRLPESIDWLVSLVQSQRPDTAVFAVEALAIFRGDAAVSSRVAQAARDRTEPAIREAFERRFQA